MSTTSEKHRGSQWRKWDLQVQTILDDAYVSIDSYWDDLKRDLPDKCQTLIDKIGSKDLIKQYDSKQYFFTDSTTDVKVRAQNYAKLFLNYLDIFVEDAGVICLTDHNYEHEYLLDAFILESKDTKIKVIAGVEINVQGVHMIILLDKKPYGKQTYSEGIKALLTKLEIDNKKTGTALTVSNKSYTDVLKVVEDVGGLAIYPHCNSSNGLFQERGKTDRTHLADHFNAQKVNILQSRHKTSADVTTGYITSNNNLKSDHVFTLGSDSRCLKDVFAPDDTGNFCWIKADPTFEGLKQIIYEPTLRVFIGYAPPSHSPNVIDSFSFKIPAGAKVGSDPFCFEGLEKKFYLNPYFNCFVGGRGTGKSTILNFFGLRSIHPDSSQTFWGGLDPQGFDPADDDIFQTDGTEIFEFLGQSEVEIFARDKVRFTQAIYDRANSRSSNELAQFEVSIEGYQSNLDAMIQNVLDLRRLEQQRQAAEKEKRTLEKGLSIASSEEYTTLASEITEKTKELQSLQEWRTKVDELRDSLEGLTLQEEVEDSSDWWQEDEEDTTPQVENSDEQPSNQHVETYSKAYDEAIGKIGEISSLLAKEKFVAALQEEAVLQKAIEDKENQAKSILEKAGLSAENVAQIKSAPQKITVLEHQLSKLDEQIDAKKKAIKKYDLILKELRSTKQNYEQRLSEILQPLRDILEKQFTENEGRDIKKISLEYSFSEKDAWRAAAEEFYDRFKNDYGDGERLAEVCKFICEHEQEFGGDDIAAIQALLKGDTKTQKYLGFLAEIFKDEKNFKIFCCIRDKHIYDVKEYKLIQVKYGEKDIENASFGQRCTAVIVILLLFGNYPLIIDEPEAHLDSSLIANYLVPLLKSKKIDRQIIFATHNANFVVNGDAEKIFILEVPDKHTEFVESTIENLQHRENLLKLEGGEEAFLARKNKYHFK